MRLAQFSLCLTLASLTFSSCVKEFGTTGTGNSTEVATESCPALASGAAHLNTAEIKEKNTRLLAFFTAVQLADLQNNTCLTKDIPLEYAFSNETDDRASGLKGRFWVPGQTIRVRFLNGSATLQNRVFGYAREWESYANIHFKKVSSGASEVRVLFDIDGHWSYIGTDNLTIDACDKTMNLELLDNTPATEVRRVTLHEFGHVLGMRHEHQQPLANIPWNTAAVYAYYAQQDWTKADVDEQILNKTSVETTQYTDFDAQSIMEYPVSASLTTNGTSIGWNSQLSATDKSYIDMMYSAQRLQIRHAATGYTTAITFVLDGIYTTVKPGETIQVPAFTSGNQLAIWENATGTWAWDGGYSPAYGKSYKIVRVGSTNNLTLAAE